MVVKYTKHAVTDCINVNVCEIFSCLACNVCGLRDGDPKSDTAREELALEEFCSSPDTRMSNCHNGSQRSKTNKLFALLCCYDMPF